MTDFIKRVNSYKFTIRSSIFLEGVPHAIRTSIRIQSQGRLIYPKKIGVRNLSNDDIDDIDFFNKRKRVFQTDKKSCLKNSF